MHQLWQMLLGMQWFGLSSDHLRPHHAHSSRDRGLYRLHSMCLGMSHHWLYSNGSTDNELWNQTRSLETEIGWKSLVTRCGAITSSIAWEEHCFLVACFYFRFLVCSFADRIKTMKNWLCERWCSEESAEKQEQNTTTITEKVWIDSLSDKHRSAGGHKHDRRRSLSERCFCSSRNRHWWRESWMIVCYSNN